MGYGFFQVGLTWDWGLEFIFVPLNLHVLAVQVMVITAIDSTLDMPSIATCIKAGADLG